MAPSELDRDAALDIILTHRLNPPCSMCPPCSCTAIRSVRRRWREPAIWMVLSVAHRFELYLSGLELCNGYWELARCREQRQRFIADNARRRALGLPEMALDEAFLDASDAGLPDCAGVALGLDRLLMMMLGEQRLEEVVAFPIERA